MEVEGPVVVKRAYDVYLRSCGIYRMDAVLQTVMNKALQQAIREGAMMYEDEMSRGGLVYSVVRMDGTARVRLRKRGPRAFEEIPPSEINAVSLHLAERDHYDIGSEEHMRAVHEWFDLKRLTTQTRQILVDIINKKFPYVLEYLLGVEVGTLLKC